jgi:hypothetical protein
VVGKGTEEASDLLSVVEVGDSNSTAPLASVRGQGAVGPVICGFCERLLTAVVRG